jgi:hypothetical protein
MSACLHVLRILRVLRVPDAEDNVGEAENKHEDLKGQYNRKIRQEPVFVNVHTNANKLADLRVQIIVCTA